METRLLIDGQLRSAIKREIVERTRLHQQRIHNFKVGRDARALRAAADEAAPSAPLVMLAHGDSWFDYPLGGTIPGVSTTDIIAQLGSMGNINPMILNVSHYGDTTTDELSLSKQQRMITALRDSSNWLESGRPDAVLFSGGGNDVAGEQFCIFLDYAGTGVDGLNIDRLNGARHGGGVIQGSFPFPRPLRPRRSNFRALLRFRNS